jgi:uncharacterized protein
VSNRLVELSVTGAPTATGHRSAPLLGCDLAATPTAGPAILVLDTNVVLDWLVFDDPRVKAVSEAIVSGAVRWVSTEAMRLELADVLAREHFARFRPRFESVWAGWTAWSQPLAAAPVCNDPRLRCADPDDQLFIDLALHSGAQALLSRDLEVLKLAPRVRSAGLQICTPQSWPG